MSERNNMIHRLTELVLFEEILVKAVGVCQVHVNTLLNSLSRVSFFGLRICRISKYGRMLGFLPHHIYSHKCALLLHIWDTY